MTFRTEARSYTMSYFNGYTSMDTELSFLFQMTQAGIEHSYDQQDSSN